MEIREYLNSKYKLVTSLKNDGSAMLATCADDDRLYVIKNKSASDGILYNRLKDAQFDGFPKIYEVLEDGSGIWVVEEYIEGDSLDEYFDVEEHKVDNPEAVLSDMIINVSRIVNRLHTMNPPIIHRDLNPDNILIAGDLDIKVLDFDSSGGFTGTYQEGTVIMKSNGFAPPEEFGFKESDIKIDIYCLGATVRYLMNKIGCKSEMLTAFVEKAMAIDPRERFQNMIDVIFFIKHFDELMEEDEEEITVDLGKDGFLDIDKSPAYVAQANGHKVKVGKFKLKLLAAAASLLVVGGTAVYFII